MAISWGYKQLMLVVETTAAMGMTVSSQFISENMKKFLASSGQPCKLGFMKSNLKLLLIHFFFCFVCNVLTACHQYKSMIQI